MRRNRARTGGSAPFDLTVRRRREIESHANYIGAAETEDFWRWIVAWIWHNKDVYAGEITNAAKRMGRKITEAEAVEMLELAASTRRHMTAERLGRFLGLTYAQRQFIGITTIWCADVNKRERKAMRREKDRLYRERKRRAAGRSPRATYEAQSITAQAREEGVSRMTIYRRRKAAEQAKNAPHVTGVSAAESLNGVDGPVTRGTKGSALRAAPQGRFWDQTPAIENLQIGVPARLRAGIIAGDGVERIGESPDSLGRFDSLPVELRIMALCLPFEPARLREAA
jgi:hypothetical protein